MSQRTHGDKVSEAFEFCSDLDLMQELKWRLEKVIEGNNGDELALSLCWREKNLLANLNDLIEITEENETGETQQYRQEEIPKQVCPNGCYEKCSCFGFTM